ncbi:MAG: hypothetical protein ABN502_00310, partial [Gammaproteobacteria bacterium]
FDATSCRGEKRRASMHVALRVFPAVSAASEGPAPQWHLRAIVVGAPPREEMLPNPEQNHGQQQQQ